MSTNDIYGNYKIAADTCCTALFSNSFFNEPEMSYSIMSVTAYVQSFLQDAHNSFAHSESLVRGLAGVGIEIGFIANAFFLAPVEIAVRLAVMPIFLLASGALACCSNDRDLPFTLFYIGMAAPCITALHIIQGAISAFYSHPAFLDKEINNKGQALCHIFCQAPETENT